MKTYLLLGIAVCLLGCDSKTAEKPDTGKDSRLALLNERESNITEFIV